MRARLFGRWVGRAAIFAALGLGALVAGGVASASTYVDRSDLSTAGAAVSGSMTEGVFVALTYDWT